MYGKRRRVRGSAWPLGRAGMEAAGAGGVPCLRPQSCSCTRAAWPEPHGRLPPPRRAGEAGAQPAAAQGGRARGAAGRGRASRTLAVHPRPQRTSGPAEQGLGALGAGGQHAAAGCAAPQAHPLQPRRGAPGCPLPCCHPACCLLRLPLHAQLPGIAAGGPFFEGRTPWGSGAFSAKSLAELIEVSRRGGQDRAAVQGVEQRQRQPGRRACRCCVLASCATGSALQRRARTTPPRSVTA